MTATCHTMQQVMTKISQYLTDERPLNLDEMRELLGLWENFANPLKDVIRKNKSGIVNLKDWRMANSWNQMKLMLGNFF